MYFDCFPEMDSLQFLIMPSYRNYEFFLFRGSYRRYACCRYSHPFTIGSPVKNKQHRYSRLQ
jgi:hypothetical protein